MKNCLLCGAGKANITPDQDLVKKLPALMKMHFSGVVFDELYVRAIALRNDRTTVLIVSFDLDKAPNPAENLRILSQKYEIPIENILFFGVHTHTAPVTGERPHEKMNDKASQLPKVRAAMNTYEDYVRIQMCDAVEEAIRTLRPAKVGWSVGESHINTNRCQNFDVLQDDGSVRRCVSLGVDPEGPVDHSLFVWRAEGIDGKSIAHFINYAVHCCVMIGNDSDGRGGVGISGDIAGVVSQMTEQQLGGVAIWSSGAAGDVNPIMMNQYYYPDPKTGATATMEAEGDFAARAALRLLCARHFADIRRVSRSISCKSGQAELFAGVKLTRIPGRKWTDGSYIVAENGYEVRIHPVVVGDVLLCGIGGELYTTLGWEIRKNSPLTHSCIINHDACLLGSAGYICDDATIARFEKNLPGHFLPGLKNCTIVPGYLEKALPEAVNEVLAGRSEQ